MLKVHGYEIHDIGRDVPIEKFVEKVKEVNADAVGSSAMMTTTQIGQRKLEQALKNTGIRDKVITIVGGTVATNRWAQRIGSDLYEETPQDTLMKLDELLQRRNS